MSVPKPAALGSGLRAAALARPWLIAPALLLPAASRMLAGAVTSATLGSATAKAAGAALLLAAAAALFAELWLGDGDGLEPDRLRAGLRLYLLPLLLLALVGPAVWSAALSRATDAETALAAAGSVGAAARVLGGLALVVSSLALRAWRAGAGPLGGLAAGGREVRANPRFTLAVLFWTCALGYALAVVFRVVHEAVDAGSPVLFQAVALATDAALGAVMLFGFVAVPLHAAATGRLSAK